MVRAGIVVKVFLMAVCAMAGYLVADDMESLADIWWGPWAGAVGGMLVALVALWFERLIKRISLRIILGSLLGLVVGLLVARLVGLFFSGIENTTTEVSLSVILACVFGYMGIALGRIKSDELPAWLAFGKGAGGRHGASLKILDTSVIIDGRVADIVDAGFLEGVLVVPEFVLSELQRIADSTDASRKARGRRGLDVLKRLQTERPGLVRIERQDFENVAEVDAKLVVLALHLGAQIVTNDFNLAKVAELQGIPVLNINKLANALRPVVLPGEVLRLQILKEGKEAGQGVAYLEDGTMVIVENGSRLLGKEVEASVTSILQTSAGRLIFTTLKNADHERRH